jgi:hypothetical protein
MLSRMRNGLLLSVLGLTALGLVSNACSSDSSSDAAGSEAGQAGENERGGSGSSNVGGSTSHGGSAGERASASGAAGEVAAMGGAGEGGGGTASDAGAAGGGMGGAQTGEGGSGGADRCDFGEASSAGTDEALNLFGEVVYFANGEALPAGHYRIQYIDGCMQYSSGQAWAVHAYADGSVGWWFVGESTADRVVMPPGTVTYSTFATFDECVAANLLLPASEFDFAGGKLGVWLADSPYSDNLAGVDNRNPKWSLVRVDCE